MTRQNIIKFLWLLAFGIAMAFLESSVVVYLRKLYYPEGFSFPLNPIDIHTAFVEIWREAATIVMLISIAIIAGKNKIERFSYFIFCFGVWDIFYYIFLKAIVAWPASLFTWDILFLIPFTWTGPVIAPVINSLTMVIIALILLYFKDKNKMLEAFKPTIYMLIIGSFLVLAAYLEEYLSFMLVEFSFSELFNVKNSALTDYSVSFVPETFSWFLFCAGLLVHMGAISFFINKNSRNN